MQIEYLFGSLPLSKQYSNNPPPGYFASVQMIVYNEWESIEKSGCGQQKL